MLYNAFEVIYMGEFEVDSLKFEWDDEKAKINVKKHGIYFEDAVLVFFDNNALYYEDDEHSYGENRVKVVGMVEKVLAVIYTERGEVNRIISARFADKHEKEDYYGQFDFD